MNPHERHARHLKATALTDVLEAVDADPDNITDESWRLATLVVAAREGRDARPPSDETKRLAVFALRERARLRGTDPFDLPVGA